jgi:hypothetical protein
MMWLFVGLSIFPCFSAGRRDASHKSWHWLLTTNDRGFDVASLIAMIIAKLDTLRFVFW